MNGYPVEGQTSAYRSHKRVNPLIAVIAIAALVAFGWWAIYRSTTPDQARVHAAVDNAAYELERTPIRGLGIHIFDVEEALSKGNPGDSRRGSVASYLRVAYAGNVDDTDYYEITNRNDDDPVCLAVTVEVNLLDSSPSFPSTSVTDGRCGLPSPSTSGVG